MYLKYKQMAEVNEAECPSFLSEMTNSNLSSHIFRKKDDHALIFVLANYSHDTTNEYLEKEYFQLQAYPHLDTYLPDISNLVPAVRIITSKLWQPPAPGHAIIISYKISSSTNAGQQQPLEFPLKASRLFQRTENL